MNWNLKKIFFTAAVLSIPHVLQGIVRSDRALLIAEREEEG